MMNRTPKNRGEDTCPYCDDTEDECRASVMSLKIGALLRLNRCNTEDYDTCSLFLAKCLRSVQRHSYAS